jgi:predicted metal-dependent hydrolase
MDLQIIRAFVISKMSWIKKEQEKFKNQVREIPREFLNRESHYYKGKRYLLKVMYLDAAPTVSISHDTIEMAVRPGTDSEKMESILNEWYRARLKETVSQLITKWEHLIGVKVNDFGVRKMKTRWSSCNTDKRKILINLELAKKPVECLEYIVVHEIVHILERGHGKRFIALMNKVMPKWR